MDSNEGAIGKSGMQVHSAIESKLLRVGIIAVQITIGKLLAILIALGYAIAMAIHAGGITVDVLKGCIALLLPLALIWFPEELGSMTGYVGRGGHIDAETPPILVSIAGWFFLVGLPVVAYLLS